MKKIFLLLLAVMLLLTSQVVYAQGPEPNGIDTIYTEKKQWIDEEGVQNTRPDSLTYRVSEKQGTRQEDHTAPRGNDDKYKTSFKVDNLDDWSTSEILPSNSQYKFLRVDSTDPIDIYPFPTNNSTASRPSETGTSADLVTIGGGWKAYENALNKNGTYQISAPTFFVNSQNFKQNKVDIDGSDRIRRVGNEFRYYPADSTFTAEQTYDGDHVTLTWPNAVTEFPNSKHDLELTITIQHIYANEDQNIEYITFAWFDEDGDDLWIGAHGKGTPHNSNWDATTVPLSIQYRVDIKIPGLTANDNNTMLLPFCDVDMNKPANGGYAETLKLNSGDFSKYIYTMSLSSNNNLPGYDNHAGSHLSVDDGDLLVTGRNSVSYGNVGFYDGILARAHYGNGPITMWFTERYGSGTKVLISDTKYMAVKRTVNHGQITATSEDHGTISDQGDWKVRNFGKGELITLKPDKGYHISYITIDGKTWDQYSLFNNTDDGYTTITRGSDDFINSGTEEIRLYQRYDALNKNVYVEIYLPPQEIMTNGYNYQSNLADHWIDVGFDRDPREQTFYFTNLLGVPGETSVSGTKTWLDGGINHDNAEDLNLTLYRWSEYTSKEPVTEYEFRWAGNTYYFTGLQRYDRDKPYTYDVEETCPANYICSKVNSYSADYGEAFYVDFTNRITGTVTIEGTKTWIDDDHEHDSGEEITLVLQQRSSNPEQSGWFTLSNEAVWEGNTYKFENLEKYDPEGYIYEYQVSELTCPEGFSCALDETTREDYRFDFINTRTQDYVDIKGAKTWLDGGRSHDNYANITLELYRYPENKTEADKEQVFAVSDGDEDGYRSFYWEGNLYTFEHLPMYTSVEDGRHLYIYEVKEENNISWDYEPTETEHPSAYVWNFTNPLQNPPTTVTGTKVWVDGGKTHDNETEVSIILMRETHNPIRPGVEVLQGVTPTWEYNQYTQLGTYTFSGLDTYDPWGYEYTYSVREEEIEGYITTVDSSGFNFTNTLNPDPLIINISGTKTWLDGLKSHVNSNDITLSLYRTSAKDGSEEEDVTDKYPVIWTSSSTYIFSDLPKFDDERYEYTYRVAETNNLEGYDAPIVETKNNGLTWNFTNPIHDPGTFIRGIKTWNDGGQTHNNASEVSLILMQTSSKPGSLTVNLPNVPQWDGNEYLFDNLELYDEEGFEYRYSVAESPVPEGYNLTVSGNNFTNTRSDLITISGIKTWDDGGLIHNNQSELTLTLSRHISGGEEEPPLSNQPTWNGNIYYFRNLQKYDETGREYVYTVTEAPKAGYTTTYDGYNITNKFTPPDYPIKKVAESSAYGKDGAPVYIGDHITYEIEFQNFLDTAANIRVTDTLPVNVKFISADKGGVNTNGTVYWLIENVPVGAVDSVMVEVEVLASGYDQVVNNAIVDVPGFDPMPVPPVVNPILYKVTHEFVSGTTGKSLPAAVTELTPQDQTGIENHTTVSPSAFSPTTVTVSDGEWRFISWDHDSEVVNGKDVHFIGTWVFYNTDLPVKRVSEASAYGKNGEPVYIGDRITYEIEYQNFLDSTANIKVTDQLPVNVSFISADNNGVYSSGNGTVTWNIQNVATGAIGKVTVIVEVLASNWDQVVNNAIVDVPGYEPIAVPPVENPLRYKVTHRFISDPAIGKELPQVVTNLTPADQLDKTDGQTVNPTDFHPKDVSVEDGIWSFISWDASSKTINKNDIEFVGTWTFREDPYTKHVSFNSEAGIAGAPVYVGDKITYQINFKNPSDRVKNVIITDTLSPKVEYVDSYSSWGSNRGSLYTNNLVEWRLENVDPGYSGFVTVTVKVKDHMTGEIYNSAKIQVEDFPPHIPPDVVNPIVYKAYHIFRSLNPEKELPYDVRKLTPGIQDGISTGQTVTPLDFTPKSVKSNTGTWEFKYWDEDSKVMADEDLIFTGYWDFIPDGPVKSLTDTTVLSGTDGTNARIGDIITYQIEYVNWLDTDATVTIRDVLPEGVEFVDASTPGIMEHRTVKWVLSSVNADSKGTVTMKVKVVAGTIDPMINEAEVTIEANGKSHTEVTPPVETPVEFLVHHKFVSHNPEKNLPAEIIGRTPGDQDPKHTGDVVYPDNNFNHNDYETETGAWKFIGWDEMSKTIGTDDVTFIGTWHFDPKPPEKRLVDSQLSGGEGTIAHIGDILNYEIVYRNWKDEAADVEIWDDLPTYAEFMDASNGGSYDAGTHRVKWIITAVTANTSGTVRMTIKVGHGMTDPIENKALVHVPGFDLNTNTVVTPLEYVVHHEFESDDDDKPLPPVIIERTPEDIPGKHTGDEVTPGDFDHTPVVTENGTWTFEPGWDKDKTTINNDDVTFTGTWHFTPIPPEKKVADSSAAGKNGAEVDLDDVITYEIKYNNWVEREAIVTITDKLPAGLEFIDADNGGEFRDGMVVWTLRLQKLQMGSVTFRAKVINQGTHLLVNDATVTIDGHDPEKTLKVETKIHEYTVHHEFTPGNLPEEILERLPGDQTGKFNHETVYPTDFDTSPVYVKGGKWVFRGWDAGSKVIDGADVTFTGTWVFVPNNNPPQFFPIPDEPCKLPNTGFSVRASGPFAELLNVDAAFNKTGLVMTIPSKNVEMELVDLPKVGDTWPVDGLGDRGGVLEGYAKPGEGYSLIAAHNTLSVSKLGPFAQLPEVAVNDLITVRDASGNVKHFYVYTNRLVDPDGFDEIAAVAENEPGSLILITCENESVKGGYLNRRVVFAKPIN